LFLVDEALVFRSKEEKAILCENRKGKEETALSKRKKKQQTPDPSEFW